MARAACPDVSVHIEVFSPFTHLLELFSYEQALMALVDVLTPNEGEATYLSGAARPAAAASELRNLGATTVVVTLGPRGALIVDEDQESSVPGIRVAAVDTTSAGDAFSGYLAVSIAEGLDLARAVRRACAAGALATTVHGARPSLPVRERVEGLLRPDHEQ